MAVYVISKNGERLMPTTRLGRVRHLLKEGKAHITKRKPFTIQLNYESTAYTQEIELCVDTGAQHIGVSVKSESREYSSIQFDLLPDEKERHDDCRKYRRTRRNRKRYRKARFNNRKSHAEVKWLAPSLANKAGRHIDIIKNYVSAAPISDVYIEMGQFDIQVLAAIQEGKPIPVGVDYQHGPQYGIDTLREAVFQRDKYTCRFCGRSAFDQKDRAILHAHHAYYWRGQHGDRLEELATCCEKCHTTANHQPDGKLWGFDEKLPRYVGAAFMNSVKWYIWKILKRDLPCNVHMTYGAVTKRSRIDLGLEKSHTNDAYAMGKLHPPVKTEPLLLQKVRRNDRILQKFYDKVLIDTRSGKKVKGKKLGCERTKRCESRHSDKNLRKYRGDTISKGHVNIRRSRTKIKPGSIVEIDGEQMVVLGTHTNYNKCGTTVTNVQFIGKTKEGKKSASSRKVKVVFEQKNIGWAVAK